MANKYITLANLKAYGSVTTTNDDTTLQSDVDWTEGEFERYTGSQFNQQTLVNETPARAWVERTGQVHLVARTAGPVTAVSAVSYYLPPTAVWNALAWDAANFLFLPLADSPPHPDAWDVTLLPSNKVFGRAVAADNVRFRWSYTAGYAVAPPALVFLLTRLAWWKYKLREAPLGKVAMPPMGITEIIPSLPNDVALDLKLWTRLPA